MNHLITNFLLRWFLFTNQELMIKSWCSRSRTAVLAQIHIGSLWVERVVETALLVRWLCCIWDHKSIISWSNVLGLRCWIRDRAKWFLILSQNGDSCSCFIDVHRSAALLHWIHAQLGPRHFHFPHRPLSGDWPLQRCKVSQHLQQNESVKTRVTSLILGQMFVTGRRECWFLSWFCSTVQMGRQILKFLRGEN